MAKSGLAGGLGWVLKVWGGMGAGGGGPRFLIKSIDSLRVGRGMLPYLGRGVGVGAPLRIPGWGAGRGVGVGILKSYQVALVCGRGLGLMKSLIGEGEHTKGPST